MTSGPRPATGAFRWPRRRPRPPGNVLADLVVRLAILNECAQIVTIDETAGPAASWRLAPRTFRLPNDSDARPNLARESIRYRWRRNQPDDRPKSLASIAMERSVLVLDTEAGSGDPWDRVRAAGGRPEEAAVALVVMRIRVSDLSGLDKPRVLDGLAARLRGDGDPPTFVGWLDAPRPGQTRARALAIVDRGVGSGPWHAPDDFRVTAIITAYNEEDVIGPTIEALIADGVLVHVIDNWSTDRTREIAESYRGSGMVQVETYPETRATTYDWTTLLGRVEEVAAASEADWVIHHDADERRLPPWPGMTLRDGLWAADQAGFNAVDHTVLNFVPVDDGFVSGTSPEVYFRQFRFGSSPDMLVQIKAWKQPPGGRVDLRSSGGHQALFPGRRVFPYRFLLKHYPVRSQTHGERKIFVDRVARWNPDERARGWHTHYDTIAPGHSFIASATNTLEFLSPDSYQTYLPELVAAAGLVPDRTPSWAREGRAGPLIYEAARGLLNSRLRPGIAAVVRHLPSPARRLGVDAKRRLLG